VSKGKGEGWKGEGFIGRMGKLWLCLLLPEGLRVGGGGVDVGR